MNTTSPQVPRIGALPKTRIDAFVLMAMVAMLLGVMPWIVFNPIYLDEWTPEILLAGCVLAFCGLRLSWIAAQGRPRLVLMTFYSFLYVWVGLAGTAQIATSHWPWPIRHLPDDVMETLLSIVAFILSFELGYFSLRWRPPGAPPAAAAGGLSFSVSDKAAAWLTVAAFGLSGFAIAMYGPNHLLVTRAQMDEIFLNLTSTKSLNLIIEKLLRVPSLVGFTVVAYNALTRWKVLDRSRKQFYFVMSFALLGLLFVTNYPPSLARHWLGTVVLTPAFALLRWRRIHAPMWILLLTAVLTIAFPYLDLFRRAASIDEAFNQLEVQQTVLEPLLSGHYDAFQMSVDTYAYTEARGSMMGRNLLGAALFWFPRSIWPTKPEGTGYLVGQAVGYKMLILAEPLWAEFYAAFSWLGVIGLSLLYGRLVGWCERRYEEGLASGGYHSISRLMVPYFAAFQLYLMRGDLLTATALFSFAVLMFWGAALPSRLNLRGIRAVRAGWT